jgi:phosphoglycolate phosphatase-like HAD superfamily hydrolase
MPRQDKSDEPRRVAVVDIDGVLADVRHRLRHVRTTPKDWDAFFAAAPQDPVLEQGRETVTRLAEVFDVVYLSGRPEKCREDTLTWFRRHDLPAGELRLRPAGDRRPARLVKVEALDRIAETRTVVVLVDDDHDVLEAARRAGYDVLPADWMPPDPSLHEAQEVSGET